MRLRKRYQFYLFHDSHDQFILPLFQLQALGSSRSVCDPQRTDYFCHAGKQPFKEKREKVKNFKCAWNAIFFFLKLCNNVVFHFALFSLSTRTPSTIFIRLKIQSVSRNVRKSPSFVCKVAEQNMAETRKKRIPGKFCVAWGLRKSIVSFFKNPPSIKEI